MCGIAGFLLNASATVDTADGLLHSILADLAHRGPDDQGVWTDRGSGVVLGHRRLSIIDVTALGHQPMVSVGGASAVVFNGEIYNYRELKHELEGAGVEFQSASDTEVLLNGYRRWGTGVLERLIGMFAFAIWDRTTQTLFLARDRAGEKPLYYANAPLGFAFASEIAPLTAVPELDLRIDQDALSLYLQYQYVPSPHSIYRGIRKLPAGHAMTVTRAATTVWRYWDPVPIAAGPRLDISDEEASGELERLLRMAVKGQMISDVPLGAFLSGGIDSTAVVSVMREFSPTPIRTFTIGFDVKAYDESQQASLVARRLGTLHTVEYFTERDALALIPEVPGMYGEPFGDSSALPTHLVSRVARKQVTVCLSGDGGDESFGGYTRYDELERILMLAQAPWPVAAFAQSVCSRFPGRIGLGGRLLGLPPKDVFRSRVGVFRAADVASMTGTVPMLTDYDRAWEGTRQQPTRRRAMLADLLTYLPEAILVKVDRAAMSVSLETRAPLLDHRLIEFALKLPVRHVRRKRLLKQLVYKRVPRELVDRPKQGFGVPLGKWFRGELRQTLHDALIPSRMQAIGIQDYAVVRRTLASHMSGASDEYPRLWTLLVLSLWHEAHSRRPAAGTPLQLASTL
jgi:asparagine synthase (glutamine-hydrolysing)